MGELAALRIGCDSIVCDVSDSTAVDRPTRAYRHALSDRDVFLAKALRRCRAVPAARRPGLAYSISKNFVVWYSKRMAAAFGTKGACIVSVSPGSFDTEMGRLEERHGAGAMLRFAALRRFGHAAEIAELLAFCPSDKPGYLTGTDILCDGGVVAGATWKDLLRLPRSAGWKAAPDNPRDPAAATFAACGSWSPGASATSAVTRCRSCAAEDTG